MQLWVKETVGSSSWYAITYNDGKFIAVGNKAIAISSDGNNWKTMNGMESSLKAVTYDNGKFVAVGDNGYITTSTDGNTWTTQQIKDKDGKTVTSNFYSVCIMSELTFR